MAESDAPNGQNTQLDRDRLELEKQKAEQDYAIRQRELDLKARELDIKESEVRTSKWRNPLILGVAGALLGGFSSILATYLSTAEQSRDARTRAQSDLIIEATKTDRDTGRRNLLFFIKAGLMDDPDGKIVKLINDDLYPSLPPALASAQAQAKWVPINGEAPDFREALRLFRMAADKGDARAMANVGWIYENGFGLQPDCAQAMEWYKKALAAGDAIANWNIGRLYDLGCGVKQDYSEARNWYQKAAALGVPDAFRDLKKLDQGGH